ncbi:MAG: hypothetical protein U0169_24265 [Polyangiaceae bacterium]
MTEGRWIATTELVAVFPDGTRSRGAIRVAAPEPVDDVEARCTYSVEPLGATKTIHGADSLQALVLAIRMCAIELALFEKRGGHFEHPPPDGAESGEAWDGSAIFGSYLALPSN